MPFPLSRYKQSLINPYFSIRNRTIKIQKLYPFIFQVNNTQLISGEFSTIIDKNISVDWGDGGARSTYNGTDQAWSKDYGSAGNRTVRIYGSVVLTKFKMVTAGADISFDITNLPAGLTYLRIKGNNTLFGDITNLPTELTYLVICGNNTLSGDITNLPTGLTYLSIYGNNTLSGDITNLPIKLESLVITESNTLYGDITNLPAGITNLSITGSNTLYGDITNLPTGLTYLAIHGNNIIADYTEKTWTTKPSTFSFIPTGVGGLSEAEIDQLFIDFDNDLVWSAGNVIKLTGTNAAPSAASAAARTNISNEGCTITTN